MKYRLPIPAPGISLTLDNINETIIDIDKSKSAKAFFIDYIHVYFNFQHTLQSQIYQIILNIPLSLINNSFNNLQKLPLHSPHLFKILTFETFRSY